MIVHYNNQLWQLDMPYELFESLQSHHENHEVVITELTKSTYKKQQTVSVSDLEDYSILRNKLALGR